MKTTIVSIITISLILSMVSFSTGENGLNKKTSNCIETTHLLQPTRVPHDPINILNDSDFTEENGVIGGKGTYSDPYIIGGWEVEYIEIYPRNGEITKYFIINDCKILHNIYIYDVADGVTKIKNTHFKSDSYSLLDIMETNGAVIIDCRFDLDMLSDPNYGISLYNLQSAYIRNCKFYENFFSTINR